MVKKSVKSLIHRDQKDYIKRVQTAGGLISNNVQIALNRFIKFHYSVGLRDTKNINHVIRHCSVYPTNTKNGSNHNLWFVDNKETHFSGSDNNYTYSLERGVILPTNGRIDTDVTPATIGTQNLSIGYFLTKKYENTGYIGTVSGTFPNDVRMFSHPQFTNTRGIYFDVGVSEATRRTVGTISPTAGDKDSKGLTINTKINGTGKIFNKHGLRATASNLEVNPIVPTVFLELYTGTQATDFLNLGGYWFGKNISDSLTNELIEEWEALQSSISPIRASTFFSPDEITGLSLWFDATDESTIILNSGTQNCTAWNDKSGKAKNAVPDVGVSVPYINSNELQFSTNRIFKNTSGFYFGCIAIVFTPYQSVNYNSGGNANRTLFGFDSAVAYSGIKLGSTTSFLNNEVLSFLYASNDRVGFLSTSFTFNANTRYLVIFNRRSANDIDIYINNSKVTSSYNLSPPYASNEEFAIGGSYRNQTYFIGGYHEVVNYQNGLTAVEVETLKDYLLNKWSI